MVNQKVLNTRTMWSFVLNKVHLTSDLPYKFSENITIRLATQAEIKRIKTNLNNLVEKDSVKKYYEHFVVSQPINNGFQFNYIPLRKKDWRYYVVDSFMGETNNNLHLIANISDSPLNITSLYYFDIGVCTMYASIMNYFHIAQHTGATQTVSNENLQLISTLYHSFSKIIEDAKYTEIIRGINMYDALNLLPNNSEFHIIGLFAIIEMLITHNPHYEDRGDSISHQMKSKIPLLENRFEIPINYSSYFGKVTVPNIWNALYAYRSSIAHGGSVDFQTKKLKVLKDAINAKSFLNHVVRLLLRHSLQEPQLFRDLREC